MAMEGNGILVLGRIIRAMGAIWAILAVLCTLYLGSRRIGRLEMVESKGYMYFPACIDYSVYIAMGSSNIDKVYL